MKHKEENAVLVSFSKSKIADIQVVRIPDPTARTPEQHDNADMFQLIAKTEDGRQTMIAETVGKKNLPMLEDAKRSFLEIH